MSPAIKWVAALAASGFLVAVVVSGALPKQRGLVEFRATGLLKIAPDRIDRVEIIAGGKHGRFVRAAGGEWQEDDGDALPTDIAKRLSMAVQFMNTSGPMRTMKADEYETSQPARYGLDRLDLAVALHHDGQRVLAVQFGKLNPEGFAQYMRAEGTTDLYLMSRFVSAEWQAVADGTFAKQ